MQVYHTKDKNARIFSKTSKKVFILKNGILSDIINTNGA